MSDFFWNREGDRDGKKLVAEEKLAINSARLLSKGMSIEIKSKVNVSSICDHPDDVTVRTDVDTSYEIKPPVLESTQTDIKTKVSKPQEYTSIYGSGGYQIPEYKSVYDM